MSLIGGNFVVKCFIYLGVDMAVNGTKGACHKVDEGVKKVLEAPRNVWKNNFTA